ncbi:MAG: hypothetical protein SOZ02_03085 [Hallerella porci]|uniref:Uncharacterized protein n=1 Tax=Hallerella porci TaxID=1945871 RepID=A0ABX5LP16_9BACT|nr:MULTISPECIES: hypothetical protein [Hallerella]MCI5600611.1 hypothetical protein [Hallerella sp.]MDY3921129.1 hypothetical protein [Hallerella porci]PWL03629.1 hypothetical protein B0H50_10453 [Hallerella porci]
MAQIESFKVSGINNSAHFIFMKEIATRALADEAVSKNCAAQVSAFDSALKAEDECYSISRKSLATDKILFN